MRVTILGLDSPVGFFFEARYRTGIYWRFIGFCQQLAAALLLIPRTAFCGAVLFFPIVVNIAIITSAVHFKGAVYITWMMVLANL